MPTVRERILDSSKKYSHPLRCIDSFFDSVPISRSVKIKNNLICDQRYFAGIVDTGQKDFKKSLFSTCKSLQLSDSALKEISSIKNINQFYVGAQRIEDKVDYRVYAGSYDHTRSFGDGVGIEWSESNRYRSRKYFGHRYKTRDLLSEDSLKVLSGDESLRNTVQDFLDVSSMGKDIVKLSNCVKCISDKRMSIDISLDFSGAKVNDSKREISEIFQYFGHSYDDYYRFFLPRVGGIGSYLTRCQWGTDTSGENFVNIYYM